MKPAYYQNQHGGGALDGADGIDDLHGVSAGLGELNVSKAQ